MYMYISLAASSSRSKHFLTFTTTENSTSVQTPEPAPGPQGICLIECGWGAWKKAEPTSKPVPHVDAALHITTVLSEITTCFEGFLVEFPEFHPYA